MGRMLTLSMLTAEIYGEYSDDMTPMEAEQLVHECSELAQFAMKELFKASQSQKYSYVAQRAKSAIRDAKCYGDTGMFSLACEEE